MIRSLRWPAVALVALTVAALPACGSDGGSDDASRPVALLDDVPLPDTILGLDVERENVDDLLEGIERPYLDATALYSLRDEEDRLQATMQVVRFRDDAPLEDEEFRRTVVERIGAAAPQPFKVAGRDIFLTTGRRQRLAVWFDEPHLMILAVRDEFETPRTLIREALGVRL